MSKQIYGVVANSSVAAIKARAKKSQMAEPLFPGDGSIAAVFAHIKAVEMGYQSPQIFASTAAFSSAAAFVAAQSVASQYRASFNLDGSFDEEPAEDSKEVIAEIAKLITEMKKYGPDASVVKQVLGRAPYGYLRVNKKLIIDPGAAALIALSFKLRDKGQTIDTILIALQKKFPEATTTASGGQWHKARVARILRHDDMYRHGKFRNCDGKRYTDPTLIIAPIKP
jgi:hypothetical protein